MSSVNQIFAKTEQCLRGGLIYAFPINCVLKFIAFYFIFFLPFPLAFFLTRFAYIFSFSYVFILYLGVLGLYRELFLEYGFIK